MSRRYDLAKRYTEKYRAQLHPCPHCGNTDVRIVSDREIFPPRNVWGVVCATPNCDYTKVFPSVKDAVEDWELNHLHKK